MIVIVQSTITFSSCGMDDNHRGVCFLKDEKTSRVYGVAGVCVGGGGWWWCGEGGSGGLSWCGSGGLLVCGCGGLWMCGCLGISVCAEAEINGGVGGGGGGGW